MQIQIQIQIQTQTQIQIQTQMQKQSQKETKEHDNENIFGRYIIFNVPVHANGIFTTVNNWFSVSTFLSKVTKTTSLWLTLKN